LRFPISPVLLDVSGNGFELTDAAHGPANGGNGDGDIDRRDAVFSRLRLWQDKNHNGVSEANELRTLPDLGVVAIDLRYKTMRRTDEHGNQFKYRARVAGDSGWDGGKFAYDVYLRSAK
jgi:hypothetical protein